METIRSVVTPGTEVNRRGPLVDDRRVAHFAQETVDEGGLRTDRESVPAHLDVATDRRAILRALNRLFDALTEGTTGVLDWPVDSRPVLPR